VRRRSRWVRRGAVLTVVAAAVAAVPWARQALQSAGVFRVEQVEVIGTRYLDPYAVVRAAGLDGPATLLDDADAWKAGVRTLSLIEAVRVRRVPPSTVVLEVTESEPVALLAGATLRPVDATGRLLELDPAGVVLDLPVLAGARLDGPVLAPGASADAIRTLAALLQRAPELAERVALAELDGGALHLSFRQSAARVVLPAAASATHLTQLRLTLADLRARGEMTQVRTIDVRFRDQVVVSFLGGPVS
jgi:cell division septal protein FtsQ